MRTPFPSLSPQRLLLLEGLLLALVAFCGSILVRSYVFEEGFIEDRESSDWFQAEVFLEGRLKRDPGYAADVLVYPTIVTDKDLGWFSRFPPGGALLRVPGLAFGSLHLSQALAAAVTVGALFFLGVRLRIPPLILPGLSLMSPFFWLLSGTLLPDGLGMSLVALILWSYVKGRQDKQNLPLAAAGFFWSLLYLMSPGLAVCFGLPFLLDAILLLTRNPGKGAQWRALVLLLVTGVFGVLAVRVYNDNVTGHSTVSPDEVYEKSEDWGFGTRRTQGGDIEPVEHTLQRGFGLMGQRVQQVDRWILGAFPGFLVAWLALWGHGWNRRWSGLFLCVVLFVWLGHVGYWEPGLSPVGPLHSAEILPVLLTGGALGLSRIWRRMSAKRRQRLVLFGLGMAGIAVTGFPFLEHQIRQIRDQLEPVRFVQAHVGEMEVPGLLFLDPEIRHQPELYRSLALNPYGFGTPLLRLQAQEENLAGLAAAYPERNAYRFVQEPVPRIVPFRENFEGVLRQATNSHHTRGTGRNLEDGNRVAEPEEHIQGLLFYGWYPILPPGEIECRFDLRWSGGDEDRPVRIEVMTDLGNKVLASKVLTTGLEETVLRFRLDEITRVEPRVYYGGSGTLTLRTVDLIPVSSGVTEFQPDPVEQ